MEGENVPLHVNMHHWGCPIYSSVAFPNRIGVCGGGYRKGRS